MRRPSLATTAIAGALLALVVAGNASAITLGSQVTTADPLPGTGCTVPTAKTSFAANDFRMYLWVDFTGAVNGDTVEWRWFDPSDAPYTTGSFTITFDGDGCAWGSIDIAGQPPATLPGTWSVDLYLSGVFAASATFTITALPPPPSGSGAAYLELFTNEQILVPWGYEELGYRVRSFQPGLPVDVYVAMLRDGGSPQCVAPELVFATSLPVVASNVPLANAEVVVVDGFLPAGFDGLASKVYAVLVAAGTSPGDPANWVSNLAVLDLAMGTLSVEQLMVLAARGNPNAYVIQLFYDTAQRVETWTYDGGGLGQTFQFVNGRRLVLDDEDERAPGTVAGEPVFFDPGRFGPSSTPAQVRALLGDPDRVVDGTSGSQLWVFETSHMSVTVQNGLVRQVEAH